MPRRGENIYKRKDNRWEARILVGYLPNGKRKYHSIYAKSYKEAKEKKQNYLLLHPTEEVSSHEHYTKMIPFEFYVNQWLVVQKSQIKRSTYSTYVRIINAQILPKLGSVLLKDMTLKKIQEFLRDKEENGRCDGQGGLSDKTISDLAVLLNHIFDYVDKEYHYPNPIKDYKYSGHKKKEATPLNQIECQTLTQYLISHITPENLGFLASLHMGLRLGEVCALRWENIDLENQVFKVRQTLYRVLNDNDFPKTVLILSTPKTNSSIRDVPIPQFMLPFLKSAKCSLENYLITGTSLYIDPRTYQNHFKNLLRECGLRDIPYHCLRHTFATNCVILDFDIKTLSEILGHSNTTITLERYVHSSLYRKQLQMSKLSDVISSVLQI